MQDGPAQQSDSVKASGAETKRALHAGEARAMRRYRPPSRDALLRTHYSLLLLRILGGCESVCGQSERRGSGVGNKRVKLGSADIRAFLCDGPKPTGAPEIECVPLRSAPLFQCAQIVVRSDR